MKKLILASLSGVALLGMAACSDSGTDKTQTQSTTPPPATEQPAQPPADGTNTMQQKPADPAAPAQ